ncbi:MAG: DNA alkylation repair protein [Rikenellaceae bacterium]|nr:DNA alkylation repair protein [Rikenellaceae bacterium]
MNDTEKLKARINIALYRQRNGAAVETMNRMSGDTSRNYGVSLTAIRQIASEYAPCQPLADMLYAGDVRDHRLAALYIAAPASFDPDKTLRWMRDVRTAEVADCAAQALFCKIADIISVAAPLITDEDRLISHTAVMAVARALNGSADIAPHTVTELLSRLSQIKERTDRATISALTFALDISGRAGYGCEVSDFIDTLPDESKKELEWLKG